MWAAGLDVAGLVLLFVLPIDIFLLLLALAIIGVAYLACAADTLRLPAGRPRWGLVLLGWAALVMAGQMWRPITGEQPMRAFTISSASMSEALLVGDYVLTDRSRSGTPRRGDVIVFAYPMDARRDFIKRIVGMPGETVQMRDGVLSLTRTLARELGRSGVTVNALAFGWVETGHTDPEFWAANRDKILQAYAIKRLGRPGDIAPAVAFLASDLASWITGQTLSVSGGYTSI
ncbi:MAG TPA: signal peptidase I [Dongiaceae bacterium]|nr:signal peptidase I [Dongiaceae bacterium]